MKLKDIPHPCDSCFNMKPWNLHMNGDHDYTCSKKPPSKYGDPECDKLETVYVEEAVPSAQPEIIRCEDCKYRGEDECPMHHVEWVEYDDDGYLDDLEEVYDYTEDDGYCFKAER